MTPALRRVVAQVRRRRRLLAAGCLGLAVTFGLTAVQPLPSPTRGVLVAAHDLVAGQLIEPADLALRQFPDDLVPSGAVAGSSGLVARRVAGAVRAGEPLTDARLVGLSMLRGLVGQVAVPVRVVDAEVARLVRPGDRVDVVATPADPVGQPVGSGSALAEGSGSAPAEGSGGLVAVSALVLAGSAAGADPSLTSSSLAGGSLTGSSSDSGTLVVLAVPEATALRLATLSTPVSLLLRVTP